MNRNNGRYPSHLPLMIYSAYVCLINYLFRPAETIYFRHTFLCYPPIIAISENQKDEVFSVAYAIFLQPPFSRKYRLSRSVLRKGYGLSFTFCRQNLFSYGHGFQVRSSRSLIEILNFACYLACVFPTILNAPAMKP